MKILFGWFLDSGAFTVTASGFEEALGQPVLGPLGLLGLLEQQLGLLSHYEHEAVRIAHYLAALVAEDDQEALFCHASLVADPWQTAQSLLQLRDALYLIGWHGEPLQDGGARLELIAGLEKKVLKLSPSPGERLQQILNELDNASTMALAIRQIRVTPTCASFPRLWHHLFEVMQKRGVSVEDYAPSHRLFLPHALGQLQTRYCSFLPEKAHAVASSEVDLSVALVKDDTLLTLTVPNEWEAARIAAHWLAQETATAGQDAQESLLLVLGQGSPVLDRACHHLGLPRPGTDSRSPMRGPLRLLPLAFEVVWQPFEAAHWLAWLTLPYSPVPLTVRKLFQKALQKQPGWGSPLWQKAWHEMSATWISLEEPSAPPPDWLFWLAEPRYFQRGSDSGMPVPEAIEIAQRLEQWAMALFNEGKNSCAETDHGDLQYSEEDWPLLETLAKTCLTLQRVLKRIPYPVLSLGLLRKMIGSVQGMGAVHPMAYSEAAPWNLVHHLGQIWHQVDRLLIWDKGDDRLPPRLPWQFHERLALEKAGLSFEEEDKELERLFAAWRQGFLAVQKKLLWITIASTQEGLPHPLRQELEDVCPGLFQQTPWPDRGPPVTDMLDQADTPPPIQTVWKISANRIQRRSRESPSSIERLLECPLAWTFTYPAALQRDNPQEVPGKNQLLGELAHAVIARLYDPSQSNLTNSQGNVEWISLQTRELLDQWIPQRAAWLLQPGQEVERQRVYATMVNAIRSLARLLDEHSLAVFATEYLQCHAMAAHQTLCGQIDLCLTHRNHELLILDLKWSESLTAYKNRLEEGKAVQLALYEGLLQQNGHQTMGGGYFLLRRGRLLFNSPLFSLKNYQVDEAPPLTTTLVHTLESYQQRMAKLNQGELFVSGLAKGEEEDKVIPLRLDPPCSFCSFDYLCGYAIQKYS